MAANIQSGQIVYWPTCSPTYAGTPLHVGFDPYGFNFQGHMFNGSEMNVVVFWLGLDPYLGDDEAYLAYYRALPEDQRTRAESTTLGPGYPCAWECRHQYYVEVWNDVFLSNQDVRNDYTGESVPDGLLDRNCCYSGATNTWRYTLSFEWTPEGGNPMRMDVATLEKEVSVPPDSVLGEDDVFFWGSWQHVHVWNTPAGQQIGVAPNYLAPPFAVVQAQCIITKTDLTTGLSAPAPECGFQYKGETGAGLGNR
jgi:hypothetical protein